MQTEDKNEPKKPESAPGNPDAQKELSDNELASIAAGFAPPPRRMPKEPELDRASRK